DAAARVPRQARVHLGGDAPGNDLQDAQAELNEQAVDREIDHDLERRARHRSLVRPAERLVDELAVLRHLRGGLEEGGIGGGIARAELGNGVEVSRVRHHDGHGFELLEKRGLHAKSITFTLRALIIYSRRVVMTGDEILVDAYGCDAERLRDPALVRG